MILLRLSRILPVAAMALQVGMAHAAPNLIQNGGFETGTGLGVAIGNDTGVNPWVNPSNTGNTIIDITTPAVDHPLFNSTDGGRFLSSLGLFVATAGSGPAGDRWPDRGRQLFAEVRMGRRPDPLWRRCLCCGVGRRFRRRWLFCLGRWAVRIVPALGKCQPHLCCQQFHAAPEFPGRGAVFCIALPAGRRVADGGSGTVQHVVAVGRDVDAGNRLQAPPRNGQPLSPRWMPGGR